MTLAEFAVQYALETGCTKEKAHEAACVAAALLAQMTELHALADYFTGRAADFAAADQKQSNRAPWKTL